jgi:hypothetical protein
MMRAHLLFTLLTLLTLCCSATTWTEVASLADKKCKYAPGAATPRVFKLTGAEVTVADCGKKCSDTADCSHFSLVEGLWCIGCKAIPDDGSSTGVATYAMKSDATTADTSLGTSTGATAVNKFNEAAKNGYWNPPGDCREARGSGVSIETCAQECLDYGDQCGGFQVYTPGKDCWIFVKPLSELSTTCTWKDDGRCETYDRTSLDEGAEKDSGADDTTGTLDTAAPTLLSVSVSSLTASKGTLRATSSEAGKIHWVVQLAAAAMAPTVADIKGGSVGANAIAAGQNVAVLAGTEKAVLVTGLAPETVYKVYIVAEDAHKGAPNVVDAATASTFTTAAADTMDPTLSGVSVSPTAGGGTLKATSNEAGKIHWVVQLAAAAAPTVAAIKSGTVGANAKAEGQNVAVLAGTEKGVWFTRLAPETEYKMFVVAEDGGDGAPPNVVEAVTVVGFKTAPVGAPKLFPKLTWRAVGSDANSVRVWLTASIPADRLNDYTFEPSLYVGDESAPAGWDLEVTRVELGPGGKYGTGLALDMTKQSGTAGAVAPLGGTTVTAKIKTMYHRHGDAVTASGGSATFEDSIDLVFAHATKAALTRAALYHGVGQGCAVGCKGERCQAIDTSAATDTIVLMGGGGDDIVSVQYGFDDVIASITNVGHGRMMIVPGGDEFVNALFREGHKNDQPRKYPSLDDTDPSSLGCNARMLRNALVLLTDRSPFQRLRDVYDHGGEEVWTQSNLKKGVSEEFGGPSDKDFDYADFDVNINPAFRLRMMKYAGSDINKRGFVGASLSQDPSRFPITLLSNGIRAEDVPGVVEYMQAGGTVLYQNTLDDATGYMKDSEASNRFVKPFLEGTRAFFQSSGNLGLVLKGHGTRGLGGGCWNHCFRSGPCNWCDRGVIAGKCCRKDKQENGCNNEGGAAGHECVAQTADSGWAEWVSPLTPVAAIATTDKMVSTPSEAWDTLVKHYTEIARPPRAVSQNVHVFQGDWMKAAAPTLSGQLQCTGTNLGDSTGCTFEIRTLPVHGTVSVTPTGAWSYTGHVDVPSTCESTMVGEQFCSFPRKHSGHYLNGQIVGSDIKTFAEAVARCNSLKNSECGGIVQKGEGSAAVFELRENGSPIVGTTTQTCWPRLCVRDAALSLPVQNCEKRWYGTDAFTFIAIDAITSAVSEEEGDGVVTLAQGYNPSYASKEETYKVAYVRYEEACNARADAAAAPDAVVQELFFGDGMLFRPGQRYQHTAAGRPALLKVHVTSEKKGPSPNVKAEFKVGGVLKGTVCLNGPDVLPNKEEMTSTLQYAFPLSTAVDPDTAPTIANNYKGNDMPVGRCGMADVSQYGEELPAPGSDLWPGWTGQAGGCKLDVDANHKENHAKAFTAMINGEWIQPGLSITVTAGAAPAVHHDIRVNHESHVRMLSVDQLNFGFKSGFTMQHRDLMKQWLGIHLSATSVGMSSAVTNVDFAPSKEGPLTRGTRTGNAKWGGFAGLIGWSMSLAGTIKNAFGFGQGNLGSVQHWPRQWGGLGGGGNAGTDPDFQAWTHEVSHAMGRGHACGDEAAEGKAYPWPHGDGVGKNGGNGPSWTLDLTNGPPTKGAGPDDSSLRGYISWAKPIMDRGTWSTVMRSSTMCAGTGSNDPGKFMDTESDFFRFKNALWASKIPRWNDNAYGAGKPGWEEYTASELTRCLSTSTGDEAECKGACWYYSDTWWLKVSGNSRCLAKDDEGNVLEPTALDKSKCTRGLICNGNNYAPGMDFDCVRACEAKHKGGCALCNVGKQSNAVEPPGGQCAVGPACAEGHWSPKYDKGDWSPPGSTVPSNKEVDWKYDLATAPSSVPVFGAWFTVDKPERNVVGNGWDRVLGGDSKARWTFIGPPIWFEKGQTLKHYDPVHGVGAARAARKNGGKRFAMSWVQESERGMQVSHQIIDDVDASSEFLTSKDSRWSGAAATVTAIDGGKGTLVAIVVHLVDSADDWDTRAFQDRYVNPGACFDPHFLGGHDHHPRRRLHADTADPAVHPGDAAAGEPAASRTHMNDHGDEANVDLDAIMFDLAFKTRLLHDRNVPHGLSGHPESFGKGMVGWAHAQLPPTVIYTTSRPEVVSARGKVTLPTYGRGPALTEITARVVTAGAVDLRRAVVNVMQAPPAGQGDVAIAQAAVDRAHRVILGCQPASGVVQHLTPPTMYKGKPQPTLFAATVEIYSSSNEAVINSATGRIVRQDFSGGADVTVTVGITATFKEETKTKDLVVTVKKQPCDECVDSAKWVDPAYAGGAAGCSAWDGLDCNAVRAGYSLPAVVKKECPATCGVCGGVHAGARAAPTWQCGDVPGPQIEMEGLTLPLKVSSTQDSMVFSAPFICSNNGDQAQWQITAAPTQSTAAPQLFPTFEGRAMPGIRLTPPETGWPGAETVKAKAVDRWGESAEVIWLVNDNKNKEEEEEEEKPAVVEVQEVLCAASVCGSKQVLKAGPPKCVVGTSCKPVLCCKDLPAAVDPCTGEAGETCAHEKKKGCMTVEECRVNRGKWAYTCDLAGLPLLPGCA